MHVQALFPESVTTVIWAASRYQSLANEATADKEKDKHHNIAAQFILDSVEAIELLCASSRYLTPSSGSEFLVALATFLVTTLKRRQPAAALLILKTALQMSAPPTSTSTPTHRPPLQPHLPLPPTSTAPLNEATSAAPSAPSAPSATLLKARYALATAYRLLDEDDRADKHIAWLLADAPQTIVQTAIAADGIGNAAEAASKSFNNAVARLHKTYGNQWCKLTAPGVGNGTVFVGTGKVRGILRVATVYLDSVHVGSNGGGGIDDDADAAAAQRKLKLKRACIPMVVVAPPLRSFEQPLWMSEFVLLGGDERAAAPPLRQARKGGYAEGGDVLVELVASNFITLASRNTSLYSVRTC